MSLEFLLSQSIQETGLITLTNVGLGSTVRLREEVFACHREAESELFLNWSREGGAGKVKHGVHVPVNLPLPGTYWTLNTYLLNGPTNG